MSEGSVRRSKARESVNPADPADSKGRLIVLSGPSGCGKSTVVRALLARDDLPLVASVSATTRPPRPTDVEGVTYRFLSPEAFHEARRRGDFLECARVHGHWYGTPKDQVLRHLQDGRWVLLEIDVQGGLQIKRQFPESTLVFLEAPSIQDYRRRIEARGEDPPEVIQRRLAGVADELARADQYDYRVVNDTVARAAAQIRRLLLEGSPKPCGGGPAR